MTLTNNDYMPRLIDKRINYMLETFGAVCVEGPKWCGKTWTSRNHANSEINLSNPENNYSARNLVLHNVDYAFRGEFPHLIDEWQEIPSIWDGVKIKVDEDSTKGKFILTGSSTPVQKGIHHSGIGRIGSIRMRTMSLFESGDSSGDVSLMSMFENRDYLTEPNEVTLEHLINLSIRGGWPAAVRSDVEHARTMAEAYIDRLKTDACRIDGVRRDESKMGMFIKSLARNESTFASNVHIAEDIAEFDDESITDQSVATYSDILSRMFITENQPAFNPSIRSPIRVGKTPKRRFTDPSLAVAALGLTPDRLLGDLLTFGYIFESLCVRDLGIYASVHGGKVYHYHDAKGRELDAVVEMPNGEWGAFEIKTGTDKVEDAARNMKRIYSLFEDNSWKTPSFMCIISGTSPCAYRRSDGIYVVPITCLRE